VPSQRYNLNYRVVFDRRVFDFDFGAGPRFPRVSPAALLNPTSPLDPGAGNLLNVDLSFEYKPTNSLRASLDYTKSRLQRIDTNRTAFDENIFSLRSTYQFSRFTFARARLDYDTLQTTVRGQLLLGYTPNPGTAFTSATTTICNATVFRLHRPNRTGLSPQRAHLLHQNVLSLSP
jgi:hypothetical protein